MASGKLRASAPVRCGIIGYGGAFNMGRHHGGFIASTEGMEVTAVCDVDEARVAVAEEELGAHIKTYTDVDKMLADNVVDLCVVILPHNLHAPVGLKCLKAGKHVILEKPMCITVEEATAMTDEANNNNLMLTVYHNRRHDGDFKALDAVVKSGAIGDVHHVEMFSGGYSGHGDWWRARKEISGGAFYDWGAHFVDWILNMMGERKMVNVTGFFQKRVWMEASNEDQVTATIRFDDGAMATVTMSNIARARKPRWFVLGTKGAIVDQGGGHDTGSFKLYSEVAGYAAEATVPYVKTSYEKYYPQIAKHLLEGGELDVQPEQARRVIAVISLAEKSSETGEAVAIPYEDSWVTSSR